MNSLEKELLEAKNLLLELQLKKEQFIRSNLLANFVPNPGGQVKFFENSEKYGRGLFLGNRGGKSTVGTVEDVSFLLGERLFYPKEHPLRYAGIPTHGVKGYLVVSNWEKSREIFTKEGDPATDDSVGKLFKFLPKDCWKITSRNQGYVAEITVTAQPHGIERVSTLKIITTNAWKKDFLVAESGDIDFVHVDEPTEEDLFEGLTRGLVDRKGKFWILATALSQPWMYYMMEDNSKKLPKKYFMYIGSTYENITLSEESLGNFADNLTEKAKKTRLDGIPSFKSNLVIATFDERLHVRDTPPEGWKDRLTPPDNWNVAVAIDTHPQTPHAVLCVAISPEGDVVAFNELFDNLPIKGPDSISEWLKLKPWFHRCEYLLLEPAGFKAPENLTKRCFADDFYEEGLFPIPGSKQRSEIIIKMNDRFGAVKPSTTILTSCPVFIKEIKRWTFDKDDKPRDKDDHMLENFGRLLFYNNFSYVPKTYYHFEKPVIDSYEINFDSSFNKLNYNDI